LGSRPERIDLELRRLERENKRLKQIIVDKELELSIKNDLLPSPPNLEAKCRIAKAYIEDGYPVEKVSGYGRIAKSSYSYRSSHQARGRKPSTHTLTRDAQVRGNSQVVREIKVLLEQRFVDYGYIKVTWWLQYNKSYVINFKKVYRLMKKHKLLYPQRLKTRWTRKWANWEGPKIQDPLSYWLFDSKEV